MVTVVYGLELEDLLEDLEEREDAGVGTGRKVGGMVETDGGGGGGGGSTADEGGGGGGTCAAPRPTRPKTAKIVETFIFNVWTCVLRVDESDFVL